MRRGQVVEVEAIQISGIAVQYLVGGIPQARSDGIDARMTLRPRTFVVWIVVAPQQAVRTGKADVVECDRIVGDRDKSLA